MNGKRIESDEERLKATIAAVENRKKWNVRRTSNENKNRVYHAPVEWLFS